MNKLNCIEVDLDLQRTIQQYILFWEDDFQPLYTRSESKRKIKKFIDEVVKRELKKCFARETEVK